MTNLTNVQKQIIETKEPKVLVLSSAASGKSTVLVERLRYLLNQGIDPFKIVAITFTNNAASVMLERLGNPQGLFIGTVHSYCNYLLRGGLVDTSEIIKEERFDDLFEEFKNNLDCVKEVDYLLVDEAQDSTALQFEFFELIKPKNFMYVGDIKQSIYQWRDANPDYLVKLSHRPDVTVYKMNQNFRNLPDILRFAKKFLYRLGPDFEDDSISMREDYEGVLQYHVMDGNFTPYEAIRGLITIKDRTHTDWKDWFVLCRTNADIDLFTDLFEKEGVPTDTFKQADLTNSQIKEKLKENTVKILTVHSAKGLENKNVLAFNIRAYSDEEARVCYVAATRARDFLIWAKMPKKKKSKKSGVVNWE